MKKSVQSEKGAVLPFLVISLLLVGILVGTDLVKVPQIFKPKALSNEVKFVGRDVRLEGDRYVTNNPAVDIELTSPYGLQSGDPQARAQPVFEDDFNQPPGKYNWGIGENEYFSKKYLNQSYRLEVKNVPRYVRSVSSLIKHALPYSEWSLVMDFKLNVTAGTVDESSDDNFPAVGVSFGNNEMECNPYVIDCYRFYINKNGSVYLDYPREQAKYINKTANTYEYGKTHQLRVDRSLNRLKAWIKNTDGSEWKLIADVNINPNDGNRIGAGFLVIRAGIPDKRTYGVEAYFDNLKIYKLGDLPEPASGYWRYAGDPSSINNDPDGNSVKWFPYNAHPVKVTHFLPLNPGLNTFFAQFKSSSGEKSQLYSNSIEYRTQAPGPCAPGTVGCPIPSSAPSPTPSPTPDPSGKPTFNTSSVTLGANDTIEIRGSNFGSQLGYVYYSRGGSHQVVLRDGILWSDNLLRIPRAINDPTSPVPNRLVGGQYIRVCQLDQNKCSSFITLPNF